MIKMCNNSNSNSNFYLCSDNDNMFLFNDNDFKNLYLYASYNLYLFFNNISYLKGHITNIKTYDDGVLIH